MTTATMLGADLRNDRMRYVKENPRRVEIALRAYTWIAVPAALIGSPFLPWSYICILCVLCAGAFVLPVYCNYYTSPYNDSRRSATVNHVAITNAVATSIMAAALTVWPSGRYVSHAQIVMILILAVLAGGSFTWLLSWSVCRLISLAADPLLNLIRRIPDWYECQRCGYDLTGNVSGRCPECGAPTGKPVIEDD